MTEIVVTSDNHGLVKELETIYEKYKGKTSLFILCGDSELAGNHPIFNLYKPVKGNCDGDGFKTELILTVLDKRILITHGHLFGVKHNLEELLEYAKEKDIDIVLFGHTHYPLYKTIDNIVFINPGSILANYGIRGRTFAVLDIDDNGISVCHYSLDFSRFYP